MKDIRIFLNHDRRINTIANIDCFGQNFVYQIDNAVPITDFTYDINDKELKLLVPYL